MSNTGVLHQLNVIERHRDVWQAIDESVAAAYAYYREHFIARPNYGWSEHVRAFQPEVAHQVRERFDEMCHQGFVEFENRQGLFLLKVIEPGIAVKFAATHHYGRPAMNKTRQERMLYNNVPSLYSNLPDSGIEEYMVLAGYIMDIAFESPPVTCISHFSAGEQQWKFGAAPDKIDQAVEALRRAV